MNWQIASGLVASMIGGTLVALISYLSTREKVRAETRKLDAEAKRLDAEAAKIIRDVLPGTAHSSTLTAGWKITGMRPDDYEIVVDRTVSCTGRASARITAKPDARAFGAIRQDFNAYAFRGQRVRLTAQVKTREARHAALWMRVDGPDDESLAFDNMSGRYVSGTTEWTRHEIVLDVASSGRTIVFGAFLMEQGTLWVDDFELDAVDDTIPVTDMTNGVPLPTMPFNLDFED